ncbi:pappalysin-2 [Sorex araneus]|uniref:pappalysin-2 n=1 Tax=Sorex araneus TaxID=42254 RepID=UPI002433EEB7|nr:pappalysin-2 [Sorex araneus]
MDAGGWQQHRRAESRQQRPVGKGRGSPPRPLHPRLRRALQGEPAPARPQEGVSVLYFSGRPERLLLHMEALASVPREAFTVEVWVRPNGGQNSPAVRAGLFDHCSHMENDKGWALGIRLGTEEGKRDARFFFSLRTDRMPAATVLLSNHRYTASQWTHLAATYDGRRMALYVDGTRVASSLGQSGPLHSLFMATCRVLLLGGDSSKAGHCFRGHLGTLALWSTALSQERLRANAQRPRAGEEDDDLATLVLTGSFETSAGQWTPFREDASPQREVLQAPGQPEVVVSPRHAPQCGRTACDHVDLIGHYNARGALRAPKTVRYQVVNVYDDRGRRPTVSAQQLAAQHRALLVAFGATNITWEMHELRVRNSTLRALTVLARCEPRQVGDGRCDPECRHPATGYDGGDCLRPRRCPPWKLQDGVCQPECNNIANDFDDGDCCDPDGTDVSKTCFDPDSPYRAYLSVKELKELLQPNSSHFLNIYFASWAQEGLAGSATWPWEKDALTHQGGVVLNPSHYGVPGHTNTMVHELGHVLGLYHVFKGVSELESCADPCRETVASMETGDLCADTAPTPVSKLCGVPEPANDSCGFTHFPGAPFNNYMSYTDDNCTDSFTPNQVARMHCHLDLAYQQWTLGRKPTPIPLPPMVIGQTPSSLTVHWLPPIGGGVYDRAEGAACRACSEDGTFHQYAHKASSPRVCDSSGYWTPEEAVGAPDVDLPCLPNLRAWSPELHLPHANVTVPCPAEGCSLELRFLHAVAADALTMWLTYVSRPSAAPTLLDAEVLLQGGSSEHLGPLDTTCDTPLTVRLSVDGRVSGVRLYTAYDGVEVDAVMLSSKPRSPLCAQCAPVAYRLWRDPPFASGRPVEVTHPQRQFTDLEVQPGQTYQYRVQTEAGGELGEVSPALSHTHGAAFCGDGTVAG